MSLKPTQDKETVKEKLPIEEVVGAYVKLTRAGKNLRAPCPFHKERTPSFYVSPERGTFYCFGCGEKGDIFSFVQKLEGIDFRAALVQLADRAGVTLTAYNGERGPGRDEKERLFEIQEKATVFFQSELEKRKDVIEYLKGRGLTEETIATWRLGYAKPDWRTLTEHLREKGFADTELVLSGVAIESQKDGSKSVYDRFRGRIIFPISDGSGRVIGFSGRYFEGMPGNKDAEEPAKYLNSPETPLFHKSHVLYGFDRAKTAMRRSNFAILVEGQMDLLMMHQCGLTTALASSGTAFTPEHLRTIGNLTKRLVLALDSDAAGVRSALKSAHLAYTAGFDLKVAAFPEGSDPADVGRDNPEKLKAAVREAKTAIEFFLTRLRAESKDERAFRRAAEESVIPLIAAMESNIEQAHFSEVVAQTLSLPVESIRAEVTRHIREKTVSKVQTPASSPPTKAQPIPKMQLIAGLILVSDDTAAKGEVRNILGQERADEIEKMVGEEKERILFTLEADEGVIHNPKDLLIELERQKLLEEIEEERARGRRAKQEGDEKAEALSSQKLQALTRTLHGFGAEK